MFSLDLIKQFCIGSDQPIFLWLCPSITANENNTDYGEARDKVTRLVDTLTFAAAAGLSIAAPLRELQRVIGAAFDEEAVAEEEDAVAEEDEAVGEEEEEVGEEEEEAAEEGGV